MTNHWLVKQEPSSYPWEQFVRDGGTAWTGVRNYQARNNLKAMRAGDAVLYYHSVVGKCVVGVAEVAQEAYSDPTAKEEASGKGWVCVDLRPVRALKRAVSLEEIKENPKLKEIGLLRQGRLSVMPLSREEYRELLRMGT